MNGLGTAHPQNRLIRLFYQKLISSDSPDIDASFQTWFECWEQVHGRLERKRPADRLALARRWQLTDQPVDLPRLIFAIETYYLFKLRLVLWQASAPNCDDQMNTVRRVIRTIGAPEPGSPLAWVDLDGCEMLLWFVDILDTEVEAAVRDEMLAMRAVGRDNRFTGDAARSIYLTLIPKAVRHTLGEYYTPGWLAQYILEKNEYCASIEGFFSLTLFDPTCGTGAFLVQALLEHSKAVDKGVLHPTHAVNAALSHLAGLDINPVAVHAAKVNFALWLLDMQTQGAELPGEIHLPIFCADSLFPSRPAGTNAFHLPPGGVDLIAGNPPWMNWEYLPAEYRNKSIDLWPRLGLYPLRGISQAYRKEDLSTLIFAAASHFYLRNGGKISFILPQSVLQSSLNGRGFRGSILGEQVQVREVDDLVGLRLFEGAANRPAVVHATRGSKTVYPVRYRVWTADETCGRVRSEAPWHAVKNQVRVEDMLAGPAEAGKMALPWVIRSPGVEAALSRLAGACPYRARSGIFTGGANGVYTLEVLEFRPDGTARVRNVTERARRKVDEVEAVVEADLIYPMLRGREVSRWKYARSVSILCPHTEEGKMAPIPPQELGLKYPLAAAYLSRFEPALRQRKGFAGWEKAYFEQAYYAIQRIGDYTFAPYKLVWRYIASEFTCAVVGPVEFGGQIKPIFPNEKLMLIGLNDPDEAYYLCGLLSSSPVRYAVESRMVETQIAPHVIERLALPRFDRANPAHAALANICRAGHHRATETDREINEEDWLPLDERIGEVLPLSTKEIETFRVALAKKSR